jgi:acetyl-CoA acetyltransferase
VAKAGIRGTVAVVGVGATAQGEHPGVSAAELGVQALQAALDDAGMTKESIDGLIVSKAGAGINDSVIGSLAGLAPRYSASLDYGTCSFSLHLAVMAIVSGLANTIAVVFGANFRTAKATFSGPPGGIDDATMHGFFNVAGPAAMALRRHQYLYGTTERQLGVVAVTQRQYARLNPLAVQRTPLSIEQYLAAPYLVEPLRRADICLISDGGVAMVLTAADRTQDARPKPIYIMGIAQQYSFLGTQERDHFMRPWLRGLQRVYAAAEIDRQDIGALYIQDPTSVWIIQFLEALGFCGEGEAGPYLESTGMGPHSKLPINTNGGQLAESYMQGWLHNVEAVRQLRGECGDRQLPRIEVAQHCSSGGFERGATTVYASRIR